MQNLAQQIRHIQNFVHFADNMYFLVNLSFEIWANRINQECGHELGYALYFNAKSKTLLFYQLLPVFPNVLKHGVNHFFANLFGRAAILHFS